MLLIVIFLCFLTLNFSSKFWSHSHLKLRNKSISPHHWGQNGQALFPLLYPTLCLLQETSGLQIPSPGPHRTHQAHPRQLLCSPSPPHGSPSPPHGSPNPPHIFSRMDPQVQPLPHFLLCLHHTRARAHTHELLFLKPKSTNERNPSYSG